MPKLTIIGKSLQGMNDVQRRDRLLYLTGVIEGIAFETVYFIDELIDHGNYLEVAWETMPSLEHMACVLDAWKQYSVSGVGVVQHTFQTPTSCFTAVYAHSASDLQMHREVLAKSGHAFCIEIESEPHHNSQHIDAQLMAQEQTSDSCPF